MDTERNKKTIRFLVLNLFDWLVWLTEALVHTIGYMAGCCFGLVLWLMIWREVPVLGGLLVLVALSFVYSLCFPAISLVVKAKYYLEDYKSGY